MKPYKQIVCQHQHRDQASSLGPLMAWSKCLMPLQMALSDFIFVFVFVLAAAAAWVTFLGGLTWLK